MSLGVLNNIASLTAENYLNITTQEANKSLQQLASGSRINSGSDDAAGLAISDGLNANVAALNQSSQNVTDGIGLAQTADGAYSQVTSLLNRAVTLATEAANGTVGTSQLAAINSEYKAIQTAIDNIGTTTNYNGTGIFGGTGVTIFTSDGSATGATSVTIAAAALSTTALGLTAATNNAGNTQATAGLDSATDAAAELQKITTAIGTISQARGTLGATVEQLQAASAVATTESQNLASASNDIRSADIGQVVANDTKYSVLEQTGISALQQANQQSQSVLKLLQ